MSYLQRLFTQASQVLNRPEQDLLPIYRLFQENWFDSAEAIARMTDQDFESLKVPKRLAIVLRQLVGAKPISKPAPEEEHEPTYEEVFGEFMDRLKHETSVNKQAMRQATLLLQVILRNIINNPCDEKYRKLKLTNQKVKDTILCYPCCGELLQFMGFEKHEDCYLMLEVEFDHLQFTNHHLQICISTIEEMFDPYQSSLQPEPVVVQPQTGPEAVANPATI